MRRGSVPHRHGAGWVRQGRYRYRLRTEPPVGTRAEAGRRSEEHTSELQSQSNLVCRLLLEKKNERDHDSALQSRLTSLIPVVRQSERARHTTYYVAPSTSIFGTSSASIVKPAG